MNPKKQPRADGQTQERKGRSTDKIIDERTDEMMAVIRSKPRISMFALRKLFVPRWGCHWKTVDRILGKARHEMRKLIGRTREELRVESYERYCSVMEMKGVRPSDITAAQSEIDDLLGLKMPRRTELSGVDGAPIQTEDVTPVPELSNSRLRAIIANIESTLAEKPSKQG